MNSSTPTRLLPTLLKRSEPFTECPDNANSIYHPANRVILYDDAYDEDTSYQFGMFNKANDDEPDDDFEGSPQGALSSTCHKDALGIFDTDSAETLEP